MHNINLSTTFININSLMHNNFMQAHNSIIFKACRFTLQHIKHHKQHQIIIELGNNTEILNRRVKTDCPDHECLFQGHGVHHRDEGHPFIHLLHLSPLPSSVIPQNILTVCSSLANGLQPF